MSINSAMLAGVSGLIANSSALAAISDNIANVNTVGFKRSTSNFSTLVTSGTKNQAYSAGGVKAQTHQFISQQGLTQSTTSNLDLSISGSGFFVTTEKPENLTAADTRSFTRAGSFQLDSLGYLRNDAGLYLQGWLADPVSGTITPDPSDLTQLSSINVGSVGGTAEKTTRVGVNANLRSEQPVAAAVSYKVTPSYTNVATTPASTPRTYDVVYSSTGAANPAASGNNEYQVEIKENGVVIASGVVGYNPATGNIATSTLKPKGAAAPNGTTTTVNIDTAATPTTVSLTDLGINNDTSAKAGKLYDPSTWSMSDYAKDTSKGVKPDFLAELNSRLARGDRGGAVGYFMVDMVGGPAAALDFKAQTARFQNDDIVLDLENLSVKAPQHGFRPSREIIRDSVAYRHRPVRAMASASAASTGLGGTWRRRISETMRFTWVFVAVPLPATAIFTSAGLGWYSGSRFFAASRSTTPLACQTASAVVVFLPKKSLSTEMMSGFSRSIASCKLL